MENKKLTTRVGMSYVRDHEWFNYADGDMMILYDLKNLETSGTMEMEMVFIMICKDGTFNAEYNNRRISMHGKDMLICPPGTKLDNLTHSPDFDAVLFGLSYEKFQKTICSGLDIWALLLFASKHPVFHLLDIDIELTDGYFKVVEKKLQTSKEFYYKEIMNSLMEAIFYEICVVINREIKLNPKESYGTQGENIFKKFIESITCFGKTERTVGFYADRLFISPKYLSAVIKTMSGKPALEWILEYSTDAIAHELRYSDLSIKEIANDFRFPSISSFGKFVKKRLGTSPRIYRTMHRKSSK
jgi:AraC-type DNA-binding domain-containing proteins